MIAKDIQSDFPILSQEMHSGKKIVYLDSASTSQKPQVVIDAIQSYYQHDNANVHRGVYALADRSTEKYELARRRIASFFGTSQKNLILTRNTTESLNWIIPMWLKNRMKKRPTIIVSEMEHHSNFVPWQRACEEFGGKLKVWKVQSDGTLRMNDLELLLDESVAIVAVSHVSNVLGTLNPVEKIQAMVKKFGAELVVDGAQSAPHLPLDFSALGVAFFACSGHKMLGPMGIGCLLVRSDILEDCEPVLFGGGMIDQVSTQGTTFAELPDKFIPGTPDVASAVGLAQACEYLDMLGMSEVSSYDHALVKYGLERLAQIPELRIIGPLDPNVRVGSIAFLYDQVHGHDVAQILDSEGVAVRSGHHCTMPLHSAFGWQATVRASFSVYNSTEDIDALCTALNKVKTIFRK